MSFSESMPKGLDFFVDKANQIPSSHNASEKEFLTLAKHLLQSLERRDLCLKSLSTVKSSEILGLNQVFYLFAKKIPKTLSFHIALSARIHEEDLSLLKNNEELEDNSILMQESELLYISRKSGIDSLNLINDFKKMIQNEDMLLSTLINVQKPDLYKIIESSTEEFSKRESPEHFPLHKDDLNRRLSERLMMTGCSRQLNLKFTGLHHHTINNIYAKCPHEIPEQRLARGKQHQIMLDHTKNLFVMFMLEMYSLSFDILNHKLNHKTPLLNKPQALLDPALACGAYNSAKLLFKYSQMRLWHDDEENASLPYFDEFVKILEEYLQGSAIAVACARCHTPYLFFKAAPNDLEFIRGESKHLNCPLCATHAEYIIDESLDI